MIDINFLIGVLCGIIIMKIIFYIFIYRMLRLFSPKRTGEMKMKKTEFKKYTRKEIEDFCENNFIENVDWLWNFVKGLDYVNLDMVSEGEKTEDGNEKGILVIKINEGDYP